MAAWDGSLSRVGCAFGALRWADRPFGERWAGQLQRSGGCVKDLLFVEDGVRTWTKRLLLAFVPMLISLDASAGGFEFPSNGTAALSRGGAFTARADDLSAIELNPAGLLAIKGTYFYLGNNFSIYNMDHTPQIASFENIGSEEEPFYEYDKRVGWKAGRSVSNGADPQLLGPLAGVSTDFGLRDWRFALGVFGPSANAVTSYPPNGDQRYALVSTDVKLAYYTASVAWAPLDNFRVGLSLHWADLMQAKLALVVVGGWEGLLPSDLGGPSFDTLASLDVSDRFGLNATLGVHWQVTPFLEVGASFRGPSLSFEADGNTSLQFQGDKMQNLYEQGQDPEADGGLLAFRNSDDKPTTKIPSKMFFDYPMIGRLGVRYIHREVPGDAKSPEVWDIEADFVWEGWSALESYKFEIDGYFMLQGSGATNTEKLQLGTITVPRKYKDTYSARLGGQYRPLSWMALRAGTYYETGSVPESHTTLDFASFDRMGIGVGLQFDIDSLGIAVGYSHIFQAKRTIATDQSGIMKQYPLQNTSPSGEDYQVGAGTYESSFDIFSVGLSYTL